MSNTTVPPTHSENEGMLTHTIDQPTLFCFASPNEVEYHFKCSCCGNRPGWLFIIEDNLGKAYRALLEEGYGNCGQCIAESMVTDCDIIKMGKRVHKLTLEEFGQFDVSYRRN